MKNKIFFLPASQIDNTGDVLINKILLDQLRESGELIVNDENKPDWFLKEIGVLASERLSVHTSDKFYPYLQSCLKADKESRFSLVIHPGHTSRSGYRSAIYGDHGFFFTRFLKRLKKQGLNIVRFGFSIGPFDAYNTISELFYTTAYKKYAVRDSESYKLGKKYFLQNIVQMPDLAWSYINNNIEKQDNNDPYVVVSFRSNKFGKIHSSEYLKPIIEQLKEILPKAQMVKIVYQVKYDQAPAKEIYNALKDSHIVEFIDEKLDLQAASDLYKNADYIVSNRLHVLLLGIVQQVIAFPLIIPGDNAKIINIYKDNDLHDYILNIKDESSINIDIIKKVVSEKNKQIVRLREIINQNDKHVSAIISKSFI